MKKISFILISIFFILNGQAQQQTEQTICVLGGDINEKFVQYVVNLTHKSNPKICFIPTASADNQDNIKYWDFICERLSIEPYTLKVWVSSDRNAKNFEEILLNMDAIVVGGGNTLNMMGIWRAQGIDTILRKALDKGIILAGGSAGSICWFQTGISDSRPTELSIVDGLSFLPYSNCPHYTDSLKKEMYHQQIRNKQMTTGYAMDDLSAVLFKNGKFVEAVSQNDVNNSYYISLKNGKIHPEKLNSRILINKDALPDSSYKVIDIEKQVNSFPYLDNQDTPLNAYISIKYILANGQMSKLKQVSSQTLQERMGDMKDAVVSEDKRNAILKNNINKVFMYNDILAGVVSKHEDFYGLWYFYKENGKWLSAGEDIGGNTILGTEITFREKAKIHLAKIQ